MSLRSACRYFLLALASLGYLANGAQAHVKISAGETLTLMMCATGHSRTTILDLPGEPIEETEDTCCGDCAPSVSIDVSSPVITPFHFRLIERAPPRAPERVSPRSPLWPGAPPQGPPHRLA